METIRESDVTRGEIQFSVADRAPPDAVVFELVIDPGDPAIVNAVAAAKRDVRNWAITGGTVVYVTLGTVRTSTTLHELGHMFGLAHSSNSEDVMRTGRFRRIGVEQFSDREVLAMRLMLERPPGNQKPDNDRNASVSTLRTPGATWVSVIACP